MKPVFAANILVLLALAGVASCATGDVLDFDGEPRYWVGDTLRFCAVQSIDDNFTVDAAAPLVFGQELVPDSEGCASFRLQYPGPYTIQYESGSTLLEVSFVATHGSGLHALMGPLIWSAIMVVLIIIRHWITASLAFAILIVQFIPVAGIEAGFIIFLPLIFLLERISMKIHERKKPVPPKPMEDSQNGPSN